MLLIPAIDLRGGRVVRLEQGDYDRETRYEDDPVAVAERYAAAGASWLHVVDLDSARAGGEANLDIIRAICTGVDIGVQTGGGVRALEDVEKRLEAGASRVVVGSLCVREPDTVGRWIADGLGQAIVAGLDVERALDGGWIPRQSGWTESGDEDLFSLLDRLVDHGLRHLLCTDIERDGMFAGPSLGLYRALCERHPAVAVQASGGIGSAEDLEQAAITGVAGCIVGRALLEGRVKLAEIRKWSR
ncbi:MAG: HisA/HisF-related TIM barrel protein [Wenzhouxiangella sp.]